MLLLSCLLTLSLDPGFSEALLAQQAGPVLLTGTSVDILFKKKKNS
jgi:hypothetical protein